MHSPMTAKLKPAQPGLRVTFPGTRDPLPAEGAVVELSNYWRERIRDGSVVEVEAESAQAEQQPTSTPRTAPTTGKNPRLPKS